MSADDDLLKAEFLARKGATMCPPSAAATVGEINPGWRRGAERKAELVAHKGSLKHVQQAIKGRWGV